VRVCAESAVNHKLVRYSIMSASSPLEKIKTLYPYLEPSSMYDELVAQLEHYISMQVC
jgi:hypothetical protein